MCSENRCIRLEYLMGVYLIPTLYKLLSKRQFNLYKRYQNSLTEFPQLF